MKLWRDRNRRRSGVRWFVAAAVFVGIGRLAAAATNVILMIGDGMGPEHMRAASWYAHGREGALFMETLPRQAWVVTGSAYLAPSNAAPDSVAPKITDSAAAGTAMATGRKVFNGVLSLALPGDGRPVETVLERKAKQGQKTGLVTTDTLSGATPAAFGVHVAKRSETIEIGRQLLEQSRPSLMMGASEKTPKTPLCPSGAAAAGYVVVTNRAELMAAVSSAPPRLVGLFGPGGPIGFEYDYARGRRSEFDHIPRLSEMAAAALDVLSRSTNGFFLMIEGACIDKASHGNKLEEAVYETLEFDRAVRVVSEWAKGRDDTLVLVTADHETGGLKVVEGRPAGQMPAVTWSSKQHTGAPVRLMAIGPGTERIEGTLDNTDIYRLMVGVFERPTRYVAGVGDNPAGMGDPD